MEKKGNGCLLVIIVIALLGLIGSCCNLESDYEKAGKSFGTWVNSDPNNWTDTQKNYFNNFMDWSNNH